jgi:hypothetical protein
LTNKESLTEHLGPKEGLGEYWGRRRYRYPSWDKVTLVQDEDEMFMRSFLLQILFNSTTPSAHRISRIKNIDQHIRRINDLKSISVMKVQTLYNSFQMRLLWPLEKTASRASWIQSIPFPSALGSSTCFSSYVSCFELTAPARSSSDDSPFSLARFLVALGPKVLLNDSVSTI